MSLIKGITITLINKVEVAKDEFNHPIFNKIEKKVDNVLVAPISSTDIITSNTLSSRKRTYVIAVPKNDNNIWEDQEVIFFGSKFKVISGPEEGINELIPLSWNKKYKVEEYG